MAKITIFLMKHIFSKLPLSILRSIGNIIGIILYKLANKRRKIVLTNLKLCFPDKNESEREKIAKESFKYFAKSVLDRSWLWHADTKKVLSRINLVGEIEQIKSPQAAVLFAPHFYGLDAGGVALMTNTECGVSIYSPQKNPDIDAWIRKGREKFGDAILINRRDGVRPVIKEVKNGRYLYLLPDMDLGAQDSIFVPFFKINTATAPALPRLAKLSKARVLPMITKMTDSGYEVKIYKPWNNYPSDNVENDTAKMNEELEKIIKEMPAQYYWLHKRFKTRPEGERGFY